MKTHETLQGDRLATARRPPRRSAHLIVVFACEQPLFGGSGHDLADLDEIQIGRGQAASVERADRRLVVRLPDPWMSASHATITRSMGRYVLADVGSRNGTHVNGEPCGTRILVDGDVIEVGHTFLLFRDAVKNYDGAAPDRFAAAPQVAGMGTLVPSFASDLVLAQRIAASPVSVVMQAESGTGKELLARAIHTLSGRTGPFVAINCGAIAATLLETELFGHRKGAFSGALEDRPGLVRAADKGTLLLDEIGDLPLASQAAFLRVLQEREVLPVGAVRAIPIDVRLVAATHRRLEDLVAEGKFRADLLARMSGYTLRIPPLRDRREDMGMLVASLVARYAPVPEEITFTSDAARALLAYAWPLNVRELEKCIETAIVLCDGEPIDVAHFPDAVRAASASDPRAKATRAAPMRPPRSAPPRALSAEDEARKEELTSLLLEHGGNVTAVARAMGKARMQIQRWMKRYGIEPRT